MITRLKSSVFSTNAGPHCQLWDDNDQAAETRACTAHGGKFGDVRGQTAWSRLTPRADGIHLGIDAQQRLLIGHVGLACCEGCGRQLRDLDDRH